MKTVFLKLWNHIKGIFRFSTLSFLFIISYITIFPVIFGKENNIVAVIFTIMMSASMVRDLTATPIRHFFIQSTVLVWMAFAACFVNVLPVWLSFILNFVTLLLILYAYTYEYSNHIYFPYILSYLFLIFISPVTPQMLPRRLFGMLAGAFSIMLYQWVMGRKRMKETALDVLGGMIDETHSLIDSLIHDIPYDCDLKEIHEQMHKLSRSVYERRKKVMCVSDASFAMIDVGRGLEHLTVLISQLDKPLTQERKDMLAQTDIHLLQYRTYLHQETDTLPAVVPFITKNEKESRLFHDTLNYVRDRLLHMSDPENKTNYRKSMLSLKTRLMAAIDISEVRVIYALRTAFLLACATAFVLYFHLPHGRWLLFTLASVSLPYADDVPSKTKKRIQATLIGGVTSVIIFSLVSSAAARTVIMMLSGYISFYFSDYAATFACSTVGALGGAVFMTGFGLEANINIFLIRIGYILAGAAIGYAANCIIFPYSRSKATKALWKKYRTITDLLMAVTKEEQTDTQLYYSLIIQAHMLEEKLSKNADLENWTTYPDYMRKCREQVYKVHRHHIQNRNDMAIFKPEHL